MSNKVCQFFFGEQAKEVSKIYSERLHDLGVNYEVTEFNKFKQTYEKSKAKVIIAYDLTTLAQCKAVHKDRKHDLDWSLNQAGTSDLKVVEKDVDHVFNTKAAQDIRTHAERTAEFVSRRMEPAGWDGRYVEFFSGTGAKEGATYYANKLSEQNVKFVVTKFADFEKVYKADAMVVLVEDVDTKEKWDFVHKDPLHEYVWTLHVINQHTLFDSSLLPCSRTVPREGDTYFDIRDPMGRQYLLHHIQERVQHLYLRSVRYS